MNISPISGVPGIANFQSQVLNSLMGSAFDFGSVLSAVTNLLPASSGVSTDPLPWITNKNSVKGISLTGRNMALNDPESAYNMMTIINNKDVHFKAQFSELSQMKLFISHMQEAGEGLNSITATTGNEDMKSRLQGFVDQYNSWVQRFNPEVQNGGLLADTQAARVALYELDQSVEYSYNGAKDGMHGLSDVGITINHSTGLASLDTAKLDAMLATNWQGVVDTVQEFSANFAKSASLLNSDGNFMPRQLDNLNRAIHYIADNETSLRAEFGTGNAAQPTGQVAQALAAYNKSYGI